MVRIMRLAKLEDYYFPGFSVIKITDAMQMAMPQAIFPVKGPEKTRVPTSIAVMGSNTPSTEAFVGPMFLLETASARSAIIVGKCEK